MSVAAPVGVLPPPSPPVPSPSPDGVRWRPPLQPSDDRTTPDDVTGAAAADRLVWSLLICVGAEDTDYSIALDQVVIRPIKFCLCWERELKLVVVNSG